jgi:hypothetical protein
MKAMKARRKPRKIFQPSYNLILHFESRGEDRFFSSPSIRGAASGLGKVVPGREGEGRQRERVEERKPGREAERRGGYSESQPLQDCHVVEHGGADGPTLIQSGVFHVPLALPQIPCSLFSGQPLVITGLDSRVSSQGFDAFIPALHTRSTAFLPRCSLPSNPATTFISLSLSLLESPSPSLMGSFWYGESLL